MLSRQREKQRNVGEKGALTKEEMKVEKMLGLYENALGLKDFHHHPSAFGKGSKNHEGTKLTKEDEVNILGYWVISFFPHSFGVLGELSVLGG